MALKIRIKRTGSDGMITKVKQHLAVAAKRARDAQGKPLFSDNTVSANEEALLFDYMDAAIASIIKQLSPFIGIEYQNIGHEDYADLYITTTRYYDNFVDDESAQDNDKDVHAALSHECLGYIRYWTVGTFLSNIHPTNAEPYYRAAFDQCTVIIDNILSICNVKRVPKFSTKNYSDIHGGKLVTITFKAYYQPITIPPSEPEPLTDFTVFLDNVAIEGHTYVMAVTEHPVCRMETTGMRSGNHIINVTDDAVVELNINTQKPGA